MAVKIEKGGWALIFLVGLGLVGYSLQKYGVVNFRSVLGSRSDTSPSEPLDTSKPLPVAATRDRKSTRLNSSHLGISYAVFCLKKKRHIPTSTDSKLRAYGGASRRGVCASL